MPVPDELARGAGVVAIVVAAGMGERIGADRPKAFLDLGGRPIIAVACEAAASASGVDGLVVAAPSGWEVRARAVLAGVGKPTIVLTGGATRSDSVFAALAAVPDSCEIVLCHDAARALATPSLFDAVIEPLRREIEVAGVVPIVPVTDTIKRIDEELVTSTEPRSALGAAQTPQAFRSAALREAHARARIEGRDAADFTDDASLVEWNGGIVRAVPGEPGNFKITTESDLERARVAPPADERPAGRAQAP